jgi:hypothetical protein
MHAAIVLLLLAVLPTATAAESVSYARYACFLASPSLDGAWTDGTLFEGPFRANGPVRLQSSSPGRDNDPWFYSFTLSSGYYVWGWGSAQSTVPHPTGSELWIEPYEQMQQGPPWFVLGAPELPFGTEGVDWMVVRSAAEEWGLYLEAEDVPDGSRLLLGPDSLYLKTDEAAGAQAFSLDGLTEPVVWIENGPDDRVYLKGHPEPSGFDRPLTIGAQGDIYMSGPLEYADGSEGMLGLISVHGDGVIADDPDDNTGDDWSAPWDIETMEYLTYGCSMMLLEGQLQAEAFTEPTPQVELDLHGGVQMVGWGYTSTAGSGFDVDVVYDGRLLDEFPPWYPEFEAQGVEEASATGAARLVPSANPFAGSVSLTLPGDGLWKMTVFDAAGRAVERAAAAGSWTLDASGLPAGAYVVRALGPSGATAAVKLMHVR